MGSLSIWHWLIVLVVVVLVFGTKKLRNLGGDVGGAVRGFKDAMNEEKSAAAVSATQSAEVKLIDKKATEATPVKVSAKRKAPATKKPAVAKATPKKATAKKTSATKTTADKPAAKKTSTVKPKSLATKKAVES